MVVGSRIVRVILAASLLLSYAPTWQHSHPGGARPHTHVALSDRLGHDHLEAPCAHRHLSLFGIDFTLPVGDDDQRSNDDHAGSSQITYLQSAPVSIEMHHGDVWIWLAVAPTLDFSEPAKLTDSFHCAKPVAAPLCDTARHERSGVLLI